MAKRVYLYAFNKVLRVVDTKFLEGEAISVRDMLRLAKWMTETYPEPVVVYAVDNRPGLYKEFMEAMKTKDFTKAFKNSIKAPYINRLRRFFYIGTPTRGSNRNCGAYVKLSRMEC